MIIVKMDMMTNNYKNKITTNCPKCNSKLDIDLNVKKSFYGTKKFKNFVWKKFFIKTERSGNTYYFDNKCGPILKSQCRNFEDNRINPQNSKMRIASLYEDGQGKLNTTFNQFFCYSCGYYEFTENASYIDVLRQK